MVPGLVPQLAKAGIEVVLESGAGQAAGFLDAEYSAKGAKVLPGRAEVFKTADLIAQVRALGANPDAGAADLEYLREGQTVVGVCEPLTEHEATKKLADKGVTLFLHGDDAPHHACSEHGRSFLDGHHRRLQGGPAGRQRTAENVPHDDDRRRAPIAPAKVFVVGAGVAGLQAIASAKKLGAIVQAYDVRPAVKEQVESLGGKFVELELETDDGRGRRWLCQGARRGFLPQTAGDDEQGHRRERRRDHNGCDSRQEGADPGHR